jgi:predicted MarR family transcription regulator
MTNRDDSSGKQYIVSSSHLVVEQAEELSEFEYGLIVASNAFMRWVVRCMEAAGVSDLGGLDVLVLHSVYHRDREKRLGDLCFVLNVEDSHTVSYSLKKLVQKDLVLREKRGKETYYSVSPLGRDVVQRYKAVRQDCLTASLQNLGVENDMIGDLARHLRLLSGLYDQAARAATSL